MPHYHYAVTAMGSVEAANVRTAADTVLAEFNCPADGRVVVRIEDGETLPPFPPVPHTTNLPTQSEAPTDEH